MRLRDCVPVPHDLVHVDQASKAEVAQWTGHGPSLHGCVSAACGHVAPPCSGCTKVRVRDCEPAAHEVLQADQVAQEPTPQPTGHAWLLQVRASCLCGQAVPPSTGSVVARLRDCAPVPHDLVHTDQAENVPTTQSAAHACTLHACVSAECGQALPPFVGSALRVRLRDCEPVPHDLVHVDQALNVASKSQSTEHACTLQLRVSSACGHALPPFRGDVVERLRFCEPPPHDLVHVDQAPNVA